MVSYSLVRQLQLNAALSAKLSALGRGKSKGEGKVPEIMGRNPAKTKSRAKESQLTSCDLYRIFLLPFFWYEWMIFLHVSVSLQETNGQSNLCGGSIFCLLNLFLSNCR